MRYRRIAFDIDGTLLDTEAAILRSLRETVAEVSGKVLPEEELTFALGITGEDALKRLGLEEIPAVLALWEEKLRGYASAVTVFAGIGELLEGLTGLGCELGVVTSKTREDYADSFRRFGIDRYFRTVVCADDTEKHKPDGAPLRRFLELSGDGGGPLLYVGDSGYDSLCAENAGVDFALAGWGSRGRTVPAKYALERPADLIALVQDFGA